MQVRDLRPGSRSYNGASDVTLISRTTEKGADTARGLGLHGLGDMAVDIQGERRRVVTELLLDHLWVDAGLKRQHR